MMFDTAETARILFWAVGQKSDFRDAPEIRQHAEENKIRKESIADF